MNQETIVEPVAITLPELQPGELWAGVLLTDAGTLSHHLILLPGETEDATWQAAQDWAASIGGELPSRREQRLLFANQPAAFQPKWYWSGEQYSESFAWYQHFLNGFQLIILKSFEGRARAVRRVPINA